MNNNDWFVGRIAACDRFRPIFEREISSYPALYHTLDLSLIYSLIYQESLCQTRDEMGQAFRDDNDTRETWKGGIMQVDSCWRCTQYCADCSTIDLQIHNGMMVLDDALRTVDGIADRYNITLTDDQRIYAVLLSYNRGSKLVDHALRLYSMEQKNISLDVPEFVKTENSALNSTVYAFVNCTEKPLCTDDQTYIPVERDYTNDTFGFALLIGCRVEYGFKNDTQGDYCTGRGYGLEYPKDILKIQEEILSDAPSIDATPLVIPGKEPDLYIGELNFSGYDWFIKYADIPHGPGPNLFYHNNESAFIDENGSLHLRIQNINGTWYSSEIVLTKALGYGKYIIDIAGSEATFDKNAVFGLFTYDLSNSSEINYFHREIDFEAAKWGVDEEDSAQLTVQGPKGSTPFARFALDITKDYTVKIVWQKSYVYFEVDNSTSVVKSWNYTDKYAPIPGDEHFRINLWLFNSTPPSDGNQIQAVVKNFQYMP
jgi:hypothetical protein